MLDFFEIVLDSLLGPNGAGKSMLMMSTIPKGLLDAALLPGEHISSVKQKITVTVPRKPALAGIDPGQLLIDLHLENNTKIIKTEGITDETFPRP